MSISVKTLLLCFLIVASIATNAISTAVSNEGDDSDLTRELDTCKIKFAILESILNEKLREIETKDAKIKEMEATIESLKPKLSDDAKEAAHEQANESEKQAADNVPSDDGEGNDSVTESKSDKKVDARDEL